jgi:ribosomal protein S18 acetylase RimI-like enzyme
MDLLIRKIDKNNIPFMKKMLYEAVFWRENPNKPSLKEAIELPRVKEAIDGFGKGTDYGAVALKDSISVGAAWFRLYNQEKYIRGYIDDQTPVLVIAVDEQSRKIGVATKLLRWLIEDMKNTEYERLSLCVTKDNHALKLYEKVGFEVYQDIGDSYIMICKLK